MWLYKIKKGVQFLENEEAFFPGKKVFDYINKKLYVKKGGKL